MIEQENSPTYSNLAPLFISSVILAVVMAAASIAGIAYQTTIYPIEALRRWFVVNDAVNLAAGLPLLLVSLWLARRGKLIGLLCWPGALFYILYVYAAYVIAVPFGGLFLTYIVLASLSGYTVIGLLARVDAEAIRQRLDGRVPVRTAGGILVGLGLLTVLRQLGMVITALSGQTPVTPQELATWIADLAVMCPALIVFGVRLWRREGFGFAAGPGLLLQFGILALGLVPGLMLETPVDIAGIVVVLVMAAICLVPFAFFVREGARQ